jgi:hypothetical protein
LRAHLGLKLAFAVSLNLWAFVPYFWLQRHALFPVTVMRESALDIWLGFSPHAVWIYLSLFLLMPVAPMQMQNTAQLWRYALGVLGMSVIADLAFLFWPTAVVRFSNQTANILYDALVAVDIPLNAFPSLHAAMAVFSALCCEQIFSQIRHPAIWRGVIWTWASAIIWAMLATKQHVALDAVGGIVLGVTSYGCAFWSQEVKGRESWLKLARREEWTQ